MARIFYEWNDLNSAEQHAQLGADMVRQIETTDRSVVYEVFLARLKLARGDVTGATDILHKAAEIARRHNLQHRMSEVAAAQVLALLRQDNVRSADELAREYDLPMSQARVHLAQGDSSPALRALEPLRREAEEKDWADERVKIMVLQTLALRAQGEKDKAAQLLGETLGIAEPGGFIRTFVDEGLPMSHLLLDGASRGLKAGYIRMLLNVFENEEGASPRATSRPKQPLIEPLSQRELEVLRLVAQGLSNQEISERLFIALITVKGHNQRIFRKLQVQRRTEAVARAHELGLL